VTLAETGKNLPMRDMFILLVHLISTLARLVGPGGLRSVVAETLSVKQQMLILNRSRKRAPNLRASDRFISGICALLMRPSRLIRTAIVLKPSIVRRQNNSDKRADLLRDGFQVIPLQS
jgi:hypothetical protein